MESFIPLPGLGAKGGSPIPIDNFRPSPTPYTAPIIFGCWDRFQSWDNRQIVFVPRSGQEGAWYEFGEGAAYGLYNGVKNWCRGGWGAIINFNRHDDPDVTVIGGSKTVTSVAGTFGGDVAHLGSVRGPYWSYTKTCSKLFAIVTRLTINGGNLLVAVDGNPLAPNGVNIKTVSSGQVASGEFGNSIIPTLPAPWNTLSTLEGCKYIDCREDLGNPSPFVEVWKGDQGSHTLIATETNTRSTLSGAARGYVNGFGFISNTDTALASSYAPPSAGVNRSGRVLATYMPMYDYLSMCHALESYKPSGAISGQFSGGNHQDGGTVSQEAVSTGFFTVGSFANGSTAVSGSEIVTPPSSAVVGATTEINDGDRLVLPAAPMQFVTVQSPSGKTSNTFNLTAGPSLSAGWAGFNRVFRADWTISSGANSNVQAFSGTSLPSQGDAIWIVSASTSVFATVKSVSGSNVTLDASVTTTTGDWVVLLGCAESHSLLMNGAKPYHARPYEFIVMPTNSLVVKTKAGRSHPELGTTTSASAARGDTSITVASVSGLSGGDLIGLFGTTGRFVTRIADISGTTITLSSKLPFGLASGSRVARMLNYDAVTRFETGSAYSCRYEGQISGYKPGDESITLYNSMFVTSRRFPTGFTYASDGTPTARAWVSGTTQINSSPGSMVGAVMSGRGFSAACRFLEPTSEGFFQSRDNGVGGDQLTKVYITSRATSSGADRFPNTTILGSFEHDYRNVAY